MFVLLRKPLWILSILTVIVGLSLQVVALAFGPLVLVQPLLITGVLFGAVFAAWMAHSRLDRWLVLGALACAGGLSSFLLVARPTGQSGGFTGTHLLPLAAVLILVVIVSLAAATWFSGEVRVIALALATGVLYGVIAALMKVVTAQFRWGGITEPFQHSILYIVCVLGPTGFLLSQNTFQQGRLISPALAVITTVDPLVGIAIGVSWFDERIASSPSALAGEAISAVVLVAGIVLLTYRGEHLRRLIAQRADGSPAGSTWG